MKNTLLMRGSMPLNTNLIIKNSNITLVHLTCYTTRQNRGKVSFIKYLCQLSCLCQSYFYKISMPTFLSIQTFLIWSPNLQSLRHCLCLFVFTFHFHYLCESIALSSSFCLFACLLSIVSGLLSI